MTVGLGSYDVPDSVVVTWPDGRRQVLRDVASNRRIALTWSDALPAVGTPVSENRERLFADITDAVDLPYLHEENEFNDFDR
jgi:hypothetical protein